jgi:hypothetical protein
LKNSPQLTAKSLSKGGRRHMVADKSTNLVQQTYQRKRSCPTRAPAFACCVSSKRSWPPSSLNRWRTHQNDTNALSGPGVSLTTRPNIPVLTHQVASLQKAFRAATLTKINEEGKRATETGHWIELSHASNSRQRKPADLKHCLEALDQRLPAC